MINRIVCMKFQPQHVEDFKQLFDERKEKIKNSPGCHGVKLLQDIHDTTLFFTYSFWESEDDLNNYRHSAFFAATWKKTKAMMDGKAKAWSTNIENEAS